MRAIVGQNDDPVLDALIALKCHLELNHPLHTAFPKSLNGKDNDEHTAF